MINFTPIARTVMSRRVRASQRWSTLAGLEAAQRRVLAMLTERGAVTLFGREKGLCATDDYEAFRSMLPVTAYPELRPWVMRMIAGERDILWPGLCRRFAQSSGTSDGKSKYIPVTGDSLRLNHYAGAGDAVAHYLHNYPDSRMFAGKGFILGGSFANELDLAPGVRVGDLSANLIEGVSPLVNLFRVPPKEVALMKDWTEKVPALVEASCRENVTNISGVPSWFRTVIKEVIAARGARTIHDVWPNLEVFFHGGISMEPYRAEYASLTAPGKMRYVETYNASEGFFAIQDERVQSEPGAMLLLPDIGVFYEFVPLSECEDEQPAHAVPAWQVERGRVYALVITAANGLWRYPIGDTVRVVSVEPLRIVIAGRTRHFINAFGEEVMVYNTDAALARACEETGARALNYTIAPVFAEGGRRGRHQWLIEWAAAPADMAVFEEALDRALQSENSDYQAKRSGGIFLDRLTVTTLAPGAFDRYLASTGKLGGQRKVPRLSNSRSVVEAILALENQ